MCAISSSSLFVLTRVCLVLMISDSVCVSLTQAFAPNSGDGLLFVSARGSGIDERDSQYEYA